MATQTKKKTMTESFTPEMRDRQARGKEPYPQGEGSEDSDESYEGMKFGTSRHGMDTFAERERQGEAMSVLDNPEALMAHAQARGDSITGQRLRFTRQLCGFDEEITCTAAHGRKRRVAHT